MLVKPFMANFNSIGEQVFLRCDPKYRHFWDNNLGKPIEQHKTFSVKVKDVLVPFIKTIIRKGELDEEHPIIELNDVEARSSLILRERIVTEVGSDKLDFNDCDLVFSRLEPYLGKIIINDKLRRYIGTTEWIPLKLNRELVTTLYFKYLLLLPHFLRSFGLVKSGKRHARIAEVDFRNIIIPLLPRDQQIEISKQIAPIEERMVSINDSLSNPLNTIEQVFAREFGYSPEQYSKKTIAKAYQKRFSSFDKVFLIRSAVKFHHPKYDYASEILCRYPTVKLKTLCCKRIHRGVQPKYDSNGEILVVKTINLKHGYMDFSDSAHVTQEFSESNSEAFVQKEDILISSTGEGRGKVDIYELEESAIADSHISIVRLKKNTNPYYVLYFMHSLLGKLQLETLEMAIKGTPEIYAHQLEQMRIIDLPPKKQYSIVEEIRTQLLELQKQRTKIQRLRDQIDEILMQIIMS